MRGAKIFFEVLFYLLFGMPPVLAAFQSAISFEFERHAASLAVSLASAPNPIPSTPPRSAATRTKSPNPIEPSPKPAPPTSGGRTAPEPQFAAAWGRISQSPSFGKSGTTGQPPKYPKTDDKAQDSEATYSQASHATPEASPFKNPSTKRSLGLGAAAVPRSPIKSHTPATKVISATGSDGVDEDDSDSETDSDAVSGVNSAGVEDEPVVAEARKEPPVFAVPAKREPAKSASLTRDAAAKSASNMRAELADRSFDKKSPPISVAPAEKADIPAKKADVPAKKAAGG
eukprot:CAMPEP_0206213770 /NCGR_PEP_ID=MMETSP0047_2-20121206/1298_1 /ASSEMBLY_ACC=CAM_ASM_000192 /TAXON_ID=195065 /ORGANISM="Chroomonas mesostigmatica_cf, Strain CCMP1168" /LENGTH=286 /DNA_ID=CAMNT_0053635939 /DNA_START=34 /DNA_END=890 /DNA_ORIENTATION=+